MQSKCYHAYRLFLGRFLVFLFLELMIPVLHRIAASPDIVSEFEQNPALTDIVRVYDVSGRKCKVYNDVANEHLVITC